VSDSRTTTNLTEPKVDDVQEAWPEEPAEPAGGEAPGPYFRVHPGAKWFFLFFLIAAIAAGVAVWHYYSVRETTDDAQVDAHIAPVSARVGGTVVAVNVDDNQHVEKGEVLAQLDPKDYQVALDRVRAELADAQASARAAHTGVPITSTSTSSQLQAARANLTAAQREADVAAARLREAQANHTKATQDLERYRQLVGKDEVSQQAYDTALATEQAAGASVDAARAAVARAHSQVSQATAQVRAAETAPEQVAVIQARAGAASAAAQKFQAAVEQAELNLQYTTIRAPVAGIVSKRNVEPGQVVAPGQPLFAVVRLDDIWATANFKETELRDMHVGQPAVIHVDAFDRDFRGHVDSFGGATGARFSLLPPENATGNYVKVVQRVPVKVVFEKDQDLRRLRPGLSVVVTVKTR
jgi:membrane fusion protein (multidrug efflux system)